jgi:hypothetical protein
VKSLAAAFLVVLCASCTISGESPQRQVDGPLVFEHLNVVRLEDGSVARDISLVVTGEHVSAVARQAVSAANVRRIDASGWYAIPGLWDMHVHLNEDATWAVQLAAAAGVVGMRDMGGDIESTAELRRLGSTPGLPRLLISGPILSGPIADEDTRVWQIRTPAGVTGVLDRLSGARINHVKVHDWLAPPTWRAIVKESRSRGLPVVGHLPIQIDAREASAGQKSIEHLGNAWGGLLLDVSSQEEALKRDVRAHMARARGPQELGAFFTPSRWRTITESYSTDKAVSLSRALARDGTFVCPTLYSFAWLASRDVGPDAASDPRLAYLPASRREMLGSMVTKDSPEPDVAASRQGVLRARQRLVRTFHEHGVPLLAGTDYAQYPLVFPGFSLHDELAQLVDAGLSPLEALRTATLNVARYLNDRAVGCLEAGCRADAVFLDANPLDDIRHVARIRAVLVGGRYVDPEQRQQRLNTVRQSHR